MGQNGKRVAFTGAVVVALATMLIGSWAVWAQGLGARSTVTVYVNDEQFRPIRGATVTIEPRGQSGAGGESATYRQGITDGTGVFRARSMAAGGYRVTAEYQSVVQSQAIDLAQDAELPLTLNLVTTGVTVYGTVVDTRGHGVGGVQVTLLGTYPQTLQREDTTKLAGGFALSPVPDGHYQLAARDPKGQYRSTSREMVVQQGWLPTPQPVITLTGSAVAGAIRGRVVSTELNSEVFRLEVRATDEHGVQQGQVRLELGAAEFVLAQLPPGIYQLTLLRVNQIGLTREVGSTPDVVVAAGQTTTDVFVVDREP